MQLSQYFSVRFIRVVPCSHVSSNLHLFVREHTAHRWMKGFLFCLNNMWCGGSRIYVSHWEVDICWFHHFLIPLGGSQICLGGGVSSVEGNQEREGEIKSLTDIISTIFSNLPEGWAATIATKLFCSHARDPERYGWKVFGNFMLIKDSKKVKRGGRRERRGTKPTDTPLWSRGISC